MDDDLLSRPYISPRQIVALLAQHEGPLIANAAIEFLVDHVCGEADHDAELESYSYAESKSSIDAEIFRARFAAALVHVQVVDGKLHRDEQLHLLHLLTDQMAIRCALRIPGFVELHLRMVSFLEAVTDGRPVPGWDSSPDFARYRDVLNEKRVELLKELEEPELARLCLENNKAFCDRSDSGEAMLLMAHESQN